MVPFVVERCSSRALSVPLREPFVIATAEMTATRAALVTVEGRGARGIGEAAPLPGVTREDQADVLGAVEAAAPAVAGVELHSPDALAELLADVVASPVARAGIEAAILDAWARSAGLPLHALLDANVERHARVLHTDVTLPIAAPEHMADLARGWKARGFDVFKVKVGRELDHDVHALAAIAEAVPSARFRLDANAGFTAPDAIALLAATASRGLVVECFEEPCAKGDLDAMAAVSRASAVPVVADESVQDEADLERLLAASAARGVNVKLAKTGSLVRAWRLASRARAAGLGLMCGAMVETRVGLSAMAHVVAALGGVDWVDLDTAFLLAEDPFTGGYEARGPELHLMDGPGMTVEPR